MMTVVHKVSHASLECICFVIKVYQNVLSPDHGLVHVLFSYPVCRFKPTCSQYMIDAIRRCGWRGLLMGIQRIVRCQPWSKGGYDPVVPSKYSKYSKYSEVGKSSRLHVGRTCWVCWSSKFFL